MASKAPTILKNFPSPNRRRLGPGGLEARSRGAFWRALAFGEMIVISRALLHFERLERPPGAVDARMRAAMTLMARMRAPFEDPGLHLVWQARHVTVWSWDKTRLADLGAPESGWFMPEPALGHDRALPDASASQDGFVLLQRRDGYEGQIRQGEELVASRFWSRSPAADEIARFRRSAHGAAEIHAGDDEDGPRPILDRIRALIAGLQPVHAATLALLLIGAPFLHSAGTYARLTLGQGSAQRALAAFAEDSAGDFGALERYRSQSAQLAVYRQSLERINPLAPAADLAEAAGALEARITLLRVETDRVRALIQPRGELNPATLAQALEAQPTLVNVRLNRTANSAAWEVQAELAAPNAAAADQEGAS